MPQILSTADEKDLFSATMNPMQILSFTQSGLLLKNLLCVLYFENKASLTENKFVV